MFLKLHRGRSAHILDSTVCQRFLPACQPDSGVPQQQRQILKSTLRCVTGCFFSLRDRSPAKLDSNKITSFSGSRKADMIPSDLY